MPVDGAARALDGNDLSWLECIKKFRNLSVGRCLRLAEFGDRKRAAIQFGTRFKQAPAEAVGDECHRLAKLS